MSDFATFLIVLTIFIGFWTVIVKTKNFVLAFQFPIIRSPLIWRKDYEAIVDHHHIGRRDLIIKHLYACDICGLEFLVNDSKAVAVEHTETFENLVYNQVKDIVSNGEQFTLPFTPAPPKPKKDKSNNNKGKQGKQSKKGKQDKQSGNGLVFVGKLAEEVFANGKVGIVEHLQQPLSVGDSLKTRKGAALPIVNLQIDRVDVGQANKGDSVGIEFRDTVSGGWNLFEV